MEKKSKAEAFHYLKTTLKDGTEVISRPFPEADYDKVIDGHRYYVQVSDDGNLSITLPRLERLLLIACELVRRGKYLRDYDAFSVEDTKTHGVAALCVSFVVSSQEHDSPC